MKTLYYLPEHFQKEFGRAKDRRLDFVYERTKYTRKLKFENYSIIFNPEGRMDDRVLSLINKVRKDANTYVTENNQQLPDSKIFFLDLFNIPKDDEIVVKIDITKAYWKQAMMDGIIGEETDEYLNTGFSDYTQKAIKKVRLKALGSLATRKEIEIYDRGYATSWDMIQQPTRPLYMNVCRSIDQAMRKCKSELGVGSCIMYYWDCMFVKLGFANDVIEFFKQKDFECTKEETKMSYMNVGTKGYLFSEVDDKMYLVSSENRDLLKSIQ